MTDAVLIVAVFLWPFLALCVALVLGIALLDCFASTVDRAEKPEPGLVEAARLGTITLPDRATLTNFEMFVGGKRVNVTPEYIDRLREHYRKES